MFDIKCCQNNRHKMNYDITVMQINDDIICNANSLGNEIISYPFKSNIFTFCKKVPNNSFVISN